MLSIYIFLNDDNYDINKLINKFKLNIYELETFCFLSFFFEMN